MENDDNHNLRVLAVDDEPLILNLYQKILYTKSAKEDMSGGTEPQGADPSVCPPSFDLILCSQGYEAVQTVKTAVDQDNPIAIAFIDLRLSPGPDGMWTAEQIREIDPYIQIVLVTGFFDVDLLEMARRVPPLDKLLYLQKPFQIQEIWQFASSLSTKWLVERQFRKIQSELETMVQRRTLSLMEANMQLEEEIEKHIKTEMALRENEEKYRALFEGSRDAIYISDTAGKFLDVNQFTLGLFGYAREEMVGMDVRDIYVNPDDYLRFDKQLAQMGSVRDYEVRLRGNAGPEMDCLVTSSVWRAKQGTVLGYQGIIRDITEQKKGREALKQSLENLQKVMRGTIQAMADTVETRDPYTAGHQRRVAGLARAIAIEMGMPEGQVESVFMAGVIHDLGKISVPAEILSKPGRINESEFNLLKTHPLVGYEILKGIEFPWPIAQITAQHHERINGSGYPYGLSGDDILLEAKIMAVADVVEAMASHRPYRPARGMDVALEEISDHKGVLFDQDVVAACLSLFAQKKYSMGQEGVSC